MTVRIGERVDQLLEMALALKRNLAEAGHSVVAASPNFVRVIAEEPDRLGPQPMGQPYENIAPGLTIGFRKGAKPDLHLRPTPAGALEIELRQRTSSGWLTIEMDWNPAVLQEKRRATLLLRGTSPEPLTLNCLVRCVAADGVTADFPGQTIQLGPEPGFHAVSFDSSGEAADEARACRAIVFCPVQPFAMTLTELSLL